MRNHQKIQRPKTTKKALETYAQIASMPVHAKPQSLADPVPDLDPKHVAKAGLTLGLPSNLSKEAFRTAENDIYQIGKSHKQANKNLHMKVTATKPWELIQIDISYIEPNYKGERYQLTATCNYSGAVLTKTLKTRDLLVPCLKRWNNQVIQP